MPRVFIHHDFFDAHIAIYSYEMKKTIPKFIMSFKSSKLKIPYLK